MANEKNVQDFINKTVMKTFCAIDPLPLNMPKSYFFLVPVLRRVVNLFLVLGAMPALFKRIYYYHVLKNH